MTQRGTNVGLIVVGVVLLLLGFLAMFSIGLPVFAFGLIVLVAGVTGVHRTHPAGFWGVTIGVGMFFVGYVLVAPLSCTSQATGSSDGQTVGATACTNVLGIDYSGGPDYQPSLRPALAVGVVAGVLAGVSVRSLVSRRRG